MMVDVIGSAEEQPVVTLDDPRIEPALAELQAIITKRWPAATFQVGPGEDPPGIYLDATVDVEDTDEVMDAIVDRLIDLQVEDGLPIYVIPVRPLDRVLRDLRSSGSGRPAASIVDVIGRSRP